MKGVEECLAWFQECQTRVSENDFTRKGGGAEVLKDHRSSSKGNLAKSQRFNEEESELFVQYFHLVRRALFTMQNAKANFQTEVDREISPDG